MKTLIFGLLLALSFQTLNAQKSPIKFGEIPLEDLKMTRYDKDSSAAAVMLTDYGEAYITASSIESSLQFERHVRIKILKKEGMEWANGSIALFHVGAGGEKVTNLKAATYNLENGKVVESRMSKDNSFKEKFNKNINLQKFTLPNVKVGSVIEYSYTVSSEYLSNFPDWKFQHDIPVRLSEYWALFPEFFIFEKYMQGYVPVTSYEVKSKPSADFQVQAHHYVSKDVPAFKAEPFMTSEDNYVSKINFALAYINYPSGASKEIMGSWAKLNTELLESESFGKIIKGSGFLKKKAEEITTGITDPMQKVSAIHSYVKNTLEWDDEKDYLASNLKKVFDEDKKGTSGDINLALASMLEKINIPVDMVLLSTRDHGFVRKEYPMSSQFNYVICRAKVGDKTILLDATDKHLPMQLLPERCLNGEGLVISATNHGWINIETKSKSRTAVSGEFVVLDNGALTGKMNYTSEGYDAHRYRKAFLAKGEQEYVKDFLADKSWTVEKSEFQHVKEIDQNLVQVHAVTVQEQSTVAGEMIYINPFVDMRVKENVFKLEKREYPVDYGSPVEKLYMCKISVPEGYVVDELPKSFVIKLPNNSARYVYNMAQAGNFITLTSNLQINNSLFSQDEYPLLREFYTQLVAKQAEQIVLKKK
ncbi:MAG TPA: DUF3857 and transglutaminase domain-containing protein [Chryseolinea sp.]|nr:DUF3857 and transglutaminase domain-containing protein [Chryseolinea sp.]